MKKLVLASVALATALGGGAPAFADPPRYYSDHHDDRRYDRDDWRDDRRDWRGGPDIVVHKRTYYYVDGRRYERVRGPGWYAPPGYHARHWGHGDYVPRDYRRVVIVDYDRYHLPPPRRDQHWVRVDGDALLVGAATGIVVAAIAGAFY